MALGPGVEGGDRGGVSGSSGMIQQGTGYTLPVQAGIPGLSNELKDIMMNMSVLLRTAVLHLLPLLVIVPALGSAPAPAKPEIVVLVAMDGVSVDELADWKLPVYRELFNQGAVALLNNRTAGAPGRESSAVTISAGVRSYGVAPERDPRDGGNYAGMGVNGDEWVDHAQGVDLLKRHTGARAPLEAVVHPGIAALDRLNDSLRYQVTPGLLGETLQQAEVRTGAFGNADRGAERDRSLSLIAMNAAGWADFGDVGNGSTLSAPDRPFSVRANYPYYLNTLGTLPGGKYFVVIDTGDGARLEAARPYLTPERYQALKQQTAQECGAFVQALRSLLEQRAARYRIMLVNVAPSRDALDRGDLLSPMLMLGSDVLAGMLTSTSTRRPGLVLNTDLMATVLRFYNVPLPAGVHSSSTTVVPGIGSFTRLAAMNRQIVATYTARGPVVKGYLFVVGVSLLGVLALLLGGERARRYRAWTPRLLRLLIVAVMLGPVIFLAAAALRIHGAWGAALFALVAAPAVAGALLRWVRDLRLIFAIVGGCTLLLAVDVLAGAPLLRQSIFSYDPIAGIRFYGMGNESVGAVVGGVLLGVFALFEYRKAPQTWLYPAGALLLALVLLIGAPSLGANFGGILAALTGFSVALVMARGRVTPRLLAGTVAGACLVGAGLIALNVAISPSHQSHIGQVFALAQQGGDGVLLQTALRKWEMNLHIIERAWWGIALVAAAAVILALRNRHAGLLRRALAPYPLLSAAFAGNLAAMLVALFTNDSGVVMAAVGLLFLFGPLLLLMQEAQGGDPA